jgi:hypothetical protein
MDPTGFSAEEENNDETDEDTEKSTKEHEQLWKFAGELNKKKEELMKKYSDPNVVIEKLKNWGEQRLAAMVVKGLVGTAATKLGMETIKYSISEISVPSASFGWGFKFVGGATRTVTSQIFAIGASVFASFVADMIFPEPCY